MQPLTSYKVKIVKGSRFKITLDFSDGTPRDFSSLTGTLKLKNIFEAANNKEAIECIDCLDIAPLDDENNPIVDRIIVDIPSSYTSQLEIPDNEVDRYGESAVYAIMECKLSNDEVPFILKIQVIESI